MAEVLELQDLPQDHLSYSQINMYKRCPYQFKLRYIDKIKMKPKSQRILGSGVHTGLEAGFQEKRISGGSSKKIKNLMKDKCVETIETLIETTEIDWDEDDNKDRLKDDGVKMIDVYYDDVGKKVKPEFVEKEFQLMLNEYKFVGKIDLITKSSIIDYKTGGQKPHDEYIYYDDQLKIYRLIFPLPVENHWIIRYKVKDPQVYIFKREITEQEAQNTLRDLIIIAKLIKTGFFWKRNDVKVCSWCGYKDICQQK